MIRISICDDDIEFLEILEKKIIVHLSGCNYKYRIDKFFSGKDLIEEIEKNGLKYDIIFLDIGMPDVSGIEVARRLNSILKSKFILIFTTCLENEWSEGYRCEAFRFILKKRLDLDMEEAMPSILSKYSAGLQKENFVVFKYKYEGEYLSLNMEIQNILYLFKGKNRRILLETTKGRYELLVKPLSYYQEIINDDCFSIFVRNYLINMNKIQDYRKGSFILVNNTKIPLGASKKSQQISKNRYLQFLSERI